MDGQFKSSLRAGDLADMGITLNTVSNDKHVPEVERYIRTMKEQARCGVYNSLSFKRIPAQMIIEMIYCSIFWLNSYPTTTGGVSETLSP